MSEKRINIRIEIGSNLKELLNHILCTGSTKLIIKRLELLKKLNINDSILKCIALKLDCDIKVKE